MLQLCCEMHLTVRLRSGLGCGPTVWGGVLAASLPPSQHA